MAVMETALKAETELDNIDRLQSPTKWYYDPTLKTLQMLFREGLTTYVLKGKANLGETNGFFRIAEMVQTGVKYLLRTESRANRPFTN